jgi:hypothetical protein
VGNDPVNRIDPLGLDDVFVGVEGDLIGIVGVEGSAGFVLDTDHPWESGFFISGGVGAGANVGFSWLSGGWAFRDIEGWGSDIDLNKGAISPVILMDDEGWNGVGFGVGPGLGLSLGVTYTKTFTVRDLYDWAMSRFSAGDEVCR